MAAQFMKRLYGPRSFYRFLLDMTRMGLPSLKSKPAISKDFFERIMLAVTEVNGCRLCSQYHARLALESGMSPEEVKGMLDGDLAAAPEEEATALLFAQHYAEAAGRPEPEALKRLEETYSPEQVREILFAIRAITLGNTLGNMYDALRQRLRGNPVAESSLKAELGVLLGSVVFIPAAFVQALWENFRINIS